MKFLAYVLAGVLVVLCLVELWLGTRINTVKRVPVITTGKVVRFKSRSGNLLTAQVVGRGSGGCALRRRGHRRGAIFYRAHVELL